MKVLFVCTGNICRSPMGQYLFPLFFNDPDIEMDSAGTHGLQSNPIDPSSAQLLEADGIDSSDFRSKRLTPQLAQNADLILCFSRRQLRKIVEISPLSAKKTFMLNDFANICTYCNEQHIIQGNSLEERFQSVLSNTSLVRPMLPQVEDIADPYTKDFAAFESAHNEIIHDLGTIADALDKRGLHTK